MTILNLSLKDNLTRRKERTKRKKKTEQYQQQKCFEYILYNSHWWDSNLQKIIFQSFG